MKTKKKESEREIRKKLNEKISKQKTFGQTDE